MISVAILDCMIDTLKKGWAQDEYAYDKEGNIVDPRDEAAASWCVLGAYLKCTDQDPQASQTIAFNTVWDEIADDDPDVYNDTEGRSATDVIAVLEQMKVLV